MSFSPGPWRVDDSLVYDRDDRLLAELLHGSDPADTRLIAAAPEMLDRLRHLCLWAQECEQMLCEMGKTTWKPSVPLVMGQALLARIEGE